ncbi:MAG: hypothetical protein KF729_30440 [Sandaracinaceae bacterium]|nr:hypothetical protein [Sandaracinaceae bacterium]
MRSCLTLLILLVPAAGAAQARPVVQQRLVGQLGPTGAEHAIAVAARADLGDPRELLFTGAHAEAGLINHTSPIYSMSGGYLAVSPFAFLVLRAALLAAVVWPIGQDGAGYFASHVPSLPPLDGALGGLAHGWSATFSAVLQGAVPLGPLRAILWSELSLEHLRLGEAPYHYSARHDAVLAQSDWVLGNWAMALLEIPLAAGLALRAGAYDDVRFVPRSEWSSHQLGGAVMLAAERPVPEVGEVLAFARAGAFLAHERRAGDFALLAGVLIRYELAP